MNIMSFGKYRKTYGGMSPVSIDSKLGKVMLDGATVTTYDTDCVLKGLNKIINDSDVLFIRGLREFKLAGKNDGYVFLLATNTAFRTIRIEI